jgi:glycosyltransferase involved in cell wall biosynthesis
MTAVLLIAAAPPPYGVLADAVARFRALGAEVRLGCLYDTRTHRGELSGLGLDGHHQLPYGMGHLRPGTRRRLRRLPPGRRLWLQSRRDRWLRGHGLGAAQLVALDTNAVYTVWRLARHNTSAGASYGLAPALRALTRATGAPGTPGAHAGAADPGAGPDSGRAAADPVPARRAMIPPPALLLSDARRGVRELPQALIRTATGRPLLRTAAGARLWRSALALPGVPSRTRAALSRQVAEGMRAAGRPGGATLALTTAAARTGDPAVRTALLEEAVRAELAKGLAPRALTTAVRELLARADEAYTAGDPAAAAHHLDKALVLAFHRVVHIDRLESPLATDPLGHCSPVHASAVMRRLGEPLGRRTPAAVPPAGRPLRLLVTTSANDNFLGPVLERYRDRPGVELRFLDLADSPALKRLAWAGRRMMEYRLGGDPLYGAQLEQLLRPHLDWADTVFLDWCAGPAAMFGAIDPGETRIVVRLHSYEAFTRWPHLVDFSRIDDLVHVAPHVRDLTAALVPGLREPYAPRTHLLHNAMRLDAFRRPKEAGARFTLGLVGVAQVAKDPLWAVEVLERLRERDERYRLLLVGADMDPATSRATREYLREFRARTAPLEESGAVLRVGPTEAVAAELARTGVILSSSVREGCHVGLMEGAASGAVPVVRDWPFFAGRPNGARTLYPAEWVVSSAEEAARRVLAVTADEERWRAEGERASGHALAEWDWPVVARDFDGLLLGTG